MANKYIDVNREDYMKAMFTELVGQKRMISFADQAKMLYELTSNDPTNKSDKNVKLSMVDTSRTASIDTNGMAKDANGRFIIKKRKWKTKKKK